MMRVSSNLGILIIISCDGKISLSSLIILSGD